MVTLVVSASLDGGNSRISQLLSGRWSDVRGEPVMLSFSVVVVLFYVQAFLLLKITISSSKLSVNLPLPRVSAQHFVIYRDPRQGVKLHLALIPPLQNMAAPPVQTLYKPNTLQMAANMYIEHPVTMRPYFHPPHPLPRLLPDSSC